MHVLLFLLLGAGAFFAARAFKHGTLARPFPLESMGLYQIVFRPSPTVQALLTPINAQPVLVDQLNAAGFASFGPPTQTASDPNLWRADVRWMKATTTTDGTFPTFSLESIGTGLGIPGA